MQMKVRVLGLDAHADTVAVAVAKPDGEVRSLEVIPNRAEPVRKLIRKLSPAKQLRACCEPGPTGYLLYWQLTEPGVECAAVAPSLVPGKAGDRVKADRRDVARLARCHRAGDLSAVGGMPGAIKEMAWKAHLRLHKRYAKLAAAARTSARSSPP